MRLRGGLTHRWLKPGTSVINPAEQPPRLPPDQLIRRWPHEGHPALTQHPIPMPSPQQLHLMERETDGLKYNSSLHQCPVSKRWVDRVMRWFHDLNTAVGAQHHDVHLRFRACIREWEKICSHLPPQLAIRIMGIIKYGYTIKWLPDINPLELRHDCGSNPPMMKTRLNDTWKSFEKCLKLGAVSPWDLRHGKPAIICPVFFVLDGDKMRVVHNLKWPNGQLDPSQFPVWLETIQRM